MGRVLLVVLVTMEGLLIGLSGGMWVWESLGYAACAGREPATVALPRPSTGEAVYLDVRPATWRVSDTAAMPVSLQPALEGFEALTRWEVDEDLWFWHEDVEVTTTSSGGLRAEVRLVQVSLSLYLHQTIYLPTGASPTLIEHEHVHRRLNERWYALFPHEVDRLLRECLIGRTFVGEGATLEAAHVEARAAMSRAFNREMNLHLYDRMHHTHAAFDRLSDHGGNGRSVAQVLRGTAVDLAKSQASRACLDHSPASVVPNLLTDEQPEPVEGPGARRAI